MSKYKPQEHFFNVSDFLEKSIFKIKVKYSQTERVHVIVERKKTLLVFYLNYRFLKKQHN